MKSNLNSEESSVLIARSHVESSSGGKLRVVRLEPSKAGTRLLTSKSMSIAVEENSTLRNKSSYALRNRTKEIA